jgi:hypothetical protein
MSEFEKQVLADLAELKANMRWLVGNGKAGVIQDLATRVDRHERLLQRAGGLAAAAAGFVTLVHVAIDYLRLRH